MNQSATVPKRNEIAALSVGGGTPSIPVREIDDLKANVEALARIWSVAYEVMLAYQDGDRKGSYYYPYYLAQHLGEAERSLKRLDELPTHYERTMTLLDAGMKDATLADIAVGLAALCGLFGHRGDPQIVASVGVDLIEAEHASQIALYDAVTALLRPGKMKPSENPYESPERLPPRRFMPTMPEIIEELQEKNRWWKRNQENLKRLPELVIQARQETEKRIPELRKLKEADDKRKEEEAKRKEEEAKLYEPL
jgi:hypothetical protein